jgi:hypothetical protein
LRFTESGRRGEDGTVPAYDVRYATGTDCDSPEWYEGANAEPVPFATPLVPLGPGFSRFLFASLDVDLPLCFALEAVDGALSSPLSDIARPPARISNLSVAAHDEAGADFVWTAAGAHDHTGTATQYVMVLAAAHGGCPAEGSLLGGDFQTVKDGTDLPTPSPAGTEQTSHVPQQTPGHAWCARLQTINADGSPVYTALDLLLGGDTRCHS